MNNLMGFEKNKIDTYYLCFVIHCSSVKEIKVTFHCFWQALDEVALEEKLDDDSENSEKEVRTLMKYNKEGES